MELTVDTPVGPVALTEEGGQIIQLTWGRGGQDRTPVLARAERQLHEYFQEQRRWFDLPLWVTGLAFRQRVCAAMLAIPFGAGGRG